MQIGTQVQKLRKLKKMSLTDVAAISGVQIATLSRIENGKMTGTIESHVLIAKALGVDITELYTGAGNEEVSPITSQNAFEVISAPNEKVSTEILSRQPSTKRMLPSLIRLEGKAKTELEKGSAGSERFIFILEGSIVLTINDQQIRLNENSSLYFNSTQPHLFENPLASTAKLLSITTPVIL